MDRHCIAVILIYNIKSYLSTSRDNLQDVQGTAVQISTEIVSKCFTLVDLVWNNCL